VNPWSAIGDLILGYWKTKRLLQWGTLIFQMGLSATVTLLFVAGTVLTTTGSFALGFGSGMSASAVVLVYFFRRSPLTKGMMLVAPQDEAEQEIKNNFQTIQK
jgi:hypothetical protein